MPFSRIAAIRVAVAVAFVSCCRLDSGPCLGQLRSFNTVADARVISISNLELVAEKDGMRQKYYLTPATRVGLFGSAKITDFPFGTPLRLSCQLKKKTEGIVLGFTNPAVDLIARDTYHGEVTEAMIAVYPFGLQSFVPEDENTTMTVRKTDGSVTGVFIIRGTLVGHDPVKITAAPHPRLVNLAGRTLDIAKKNLDERVSIYPWPVTWGNMNAQNGDVAVSLLNTVEWLGKDAKVHIVVDAATPNLAHHINLIRTEPIDLTKLPKPVRTKK